MRARRRRLNLLAALVAASVLGALALVVDASTAAPRPPEQLPSYVDPDAPLREHGTGLVRFRGHGAEWWARRAIRLERQHVRDGRRTALYAIRLASRAFGVSQRDLYVRAVCESSLDASQVTPPYSASGLLQFLPSTWAATPFAAFSVFDPVANALAAAQLVAHEGWRQWAASDACARRYGASTD